VRRHILSGLLATIIVGGCADKSSGLTPEDLAAIDELRYAVTAAIIAGDATAYANLCTEDVRLLHAGSQIIAGRAELEAHNAAMFDTVSVTSLALTPVEVYGTGDLAYEVGTQELTIEPTLPEFAGSRKYVHVFRRGTDGRWRFAALMSNNN
jgi:uncharacterized protein (TIGR02246 family)